MSKSKKLFSIALAVLLALQLLLIPTFAEGETTTATGKYNTADNLPLIYGAGESLDDFENYTFSTSVTQIKEAASILIADQNFYGTSFITDTATKSMGSKSIKFNPAQYTGGFMIKINANEYQIADQLEDETSDNDLAFYLKVPSDSSTTCDVSNDYPDGRYGYFLYPSNVVNQNDAINNTKLTNFTVTYYFKDGQKLVKTNQSGIYAYTATGDVSTVGFDGYVSIDISGTGINDYKYIMFKHYDNKWNNRFSYLDDFRLVDSNNFVPYGLEDYEDVAEGTSATSYNATSKTWAATWYSASPSFDTTGIAQGKNSLKIACKDGGFQLGVRIAEASANTPIFGDDYNGLAFYVDIPAYASWRGAFSPIKVVMATGYDGGTTKVLDVATYVYWFDDGSVLVKYGDDGIYPYDKNGDKVFTGFKGYVSVYYGDVDFSTYKFIRLNTAQYNPGLTGGSQVVYFDDFRPCNFNVVEDIVSGDAYYVNNAAIPVQKVGDTATLSVMTNLAKLGMARNADGIAALRDVMLGYTTAAAKHNVNGVGVADIRDLVALYKLAV